jgi:ABC-2 type transport system ATP-binding protein
LSEKSLLIARNLSKTFRVSEREAGLRAAVRGLFHPVFREVPAVEDLTFEIKAGEMVGLLGANGAGKTTTLKLLSGLLQPTRGELEVAGFIPGKRQPAFLSQISMVLGNKSQMVWDIPALDTFHVLGEIYNIPPAQLRRTLDELIALLDMSDLLTRPVRNLSLGERMKCELVAGLLHQPRLVFLDEPTLGLDVSVQARLRSFIAEYNRRCGATILLTSHYMADIVALCPHVILLQDGRILYDGGLNSLAQRLAPFKLLQVTLSQPPNGALTHLPEGAEVVEQEGGQVTLRSARESTPAVATWLLNNLPVVDLSVQDPPVERVIDQIYQKGSL